MGLVSKMSSPIAYDGFAWGASQFGRLIDVYLTPLFLSRTWEMRDLSPA